MTKTICALLIALSLQAVIPVANAQPPIDERTRRTREWVYEELKLTDEQKEKWEAICDAATENEERLKEQQAFQSLTRAQQIEKLKALGDDIEVLFGDALTPKQRAKWQQMCFSDAVETGNIKKVRNMLKNNSSLALGTFDGWTPLFFAAKNGKKEIAEVLLAHGAEIDASEGNGESRFGRTPLYVAIACEEIEMVEFLLTKKAKVNFKAQRNRTPLHMAALSGNAEIAEMLLARGAEVNAKDDEGETAMRIVERDIPLGLSPSDDVKRAKAVIEVLRRHGGHN